MNKTLQMAVRSYVRLKQPGHQFSRTLVSQAFHCTEEWNARLQSPIFQKIKLGEYFVELDKKFSSEYKGSAVDVDIFAQAAATPTDCEQLEELLHKLRRTPHTIFSPPSTNHAALRALLRAEEHPDGGEQVHHIVKILDDRLNYGVFLDDYTTILLLDYMIEKGRVREGARIASHIMLQEESNRGPGADLGNLAAWRYCQTGNKEWFYDSEMPHDDNPDEVIRVRVKGMVPNNYNDNHFDLKDPNTILGKTLVYLNNSREDNVSKSLKFLGHLLAGEEEQVMVTDKFLISEEVLNIAKEAASRDESKVFLDSLETSSDSVEEALIARCKECLKENESRIIEAQKKLYKEWMVQRDTLLENEYNALLKRSRMEAIQQTKETLAKEEEKLFFFDNFDKLEMEKDVKEKEWRR